MQKGSLPGKDRIFKLEAFLGAGVAESPEAQATSQNSAASGNQVDDQDDQCDHQQKMDQATGYVQGEAQKPQNEKDYEDCPEHIHTLSALCTPEAENPAQAHPTHSQMTVNWKQ